MRCATLVAPRQIEIERVPRPQVDDSTVVVRLDGVGICGTNLHFWRGGGPATGRLRFPMPGVGAHEFAGTVVEAGKNVRRVRVGDRVAVDQFESTSCGACEYCASGTFFICPNRTVYSPPGFVDYLKCSEKGLYPIPESLPTHVGAVVEPAACSVSGLRRAGLLGGEHVAVLGAGVLGLAAAGAAKVLGAGRVAITAKYDQQAEFARSFGADAVVPSGEENVVGLVNDALGGRGADVVVESVGGRAPTFEQALDIVRPGGRIIVLGLWDVPVALDSWKAILKDVNVFFSATYGIKGKKADYELTLEWMAARKVPAQDLVSHVMPLEEISEAFRIADDKSRGAIKVIVTP
ncbi:MAG: alcohol dehydrogenase catalytic domain-containing protein [Dehalococcoidia bacterium]|nr:alcohol dehydrogenase catalytic domain-containing protein [Dehalococcoidia bacterium]